MASQEENTMVLGSRRLKTDAPARSWWGNFYTRVFLHVCTPVRVYDTQTGLRAFPNTLSKPMTQIEGVRYEYEMNVLIELEKIGVKFREVKIRVVYIDNNASTHFHAIRDGSKVYRVLFRRFPKYLLSSVSSFGIDYVLFNALYYLVFRNSTPSTVIARIISASCNYLINKKLVFKNSGSKYNIKSYAVLAVLVLLANMAFMKLLVEMLHWPAFLAKILVELVLYIVNFFVQQNIASRK